MGHKGKHAKRASEDGNIQEAGLENKVTFNDKVEAWMVGSHSDDVLWKKKREPAETTEHHHSRKRHEEVEAKEHSKKRHEEDFKEHSRKRHEEHKIKEPEPVKNVTSAEVTRILADAARVEKEHQRENDPTLPYWEVELHKGAAHLRQHEQDFNNCLQQERKVFDILRRKKSVYVTSGGDDMSLATLATIHRGPVPSTVAIGLVLLNGLSKILIQPKEIHRDGVCFCSTKVSRFFMVLNSHGHKLYKVEEKKYRFAKPELVVLDLNTGERVGKLQRLKRTLDYRDKIEVYSTTTLVGSVEHVWKQHPTFHVKDAEGRLIFILEMEKHGFYAQFAKAEEMKFILKDPDGVEQGFLGADFDDLTYLLYLSHHVYGITFPKDLNVVMKLLLMTASVMIAHYDGKVVKQVIHLPDKAVKDYIEYELMSANDPGEAAQENASSVSSSRTEATSIRPFISFE